MFSWFRLYIFLEDWQNLSVGVLLLYIDFYLQNPCVWVLKVIKCDSSGCFILDRGKSVNEGKKEQKQHNFEETTCNVSTAAPEEKSHTHALEGWRC